MARKTRIDAPGALHHIVVRAIERKKLFRDDTDRGDFLDRLGRILVESSTPCYAWVLMPNHVHLLLKTGATPIATVMRRLLTGYAVSFNYRHRRHGQLFHDRYRSILCQADPYLLELVRYIHLNPLRGKIVAELGALDKYAYSGHSVIMGKRENDWQDIDHVLGFFDRKASLARRRYRAYVKKGVGEGRRPDLVGGGFVRSLGGWVKAKTLQKRQGRLKGDERILGDSDFVLKALEACGEAFERKYCLQAKGYDIGKVARRVAGIFAMKPEEIYAPGKHRRVVQARSLFCYWCVRELGVSATALAKKLRLSQPAVSISVQRGETIAKEEGVELLEE
ncbi:MAG: transposase [Desulfobacterales bacterium C00003060]|nr:MAG: transposase [Desulfobacterales bacterium S3730MH5]OEU77645.1 MAG: transposase [Desulfobacterales bacterium C00003060]OEU84825.1 MAG: transposase [Desulfobacterales bacterium S5133MH4]